MRAPLKSPDGGVARGERLARWSRAALEISAGVSYASFLLVEARQPRGESGARELLFWLCVTALVVLPLFPTTLEGLFPKRLFGRAADALPWSLQLLPLALLGRDDPAHLLMGGLALLQGNLLVRAADGRAAAWSLAVGPTTVLAGWALQPAAEWLAMFPLSVVSAGAALSLVRARELERDLRARGPRVLLRALGAAPAPEREWTRRALASLPAALVVLAGVPLAHALVVATRAPLARVWERDPVQQRAAELERARARRAERASAPTADAPGARRFPDVLSFGGDVSALEGQAVMEVRPSVDGRGVRTAPLYMRGIVLDRFGDEGASFGAALPLRELRPGRDGWSRLAPAPRPALELDVLLEPLFLSGDWSPVLFTPRPLTAVDSGTGLRHHPDDRLLLPTGAQQTIRYGLETAPPRDARARPPKGPARHPDPRYLQLPAPSPQLARIAERARDAMAGGGSDAERVARLMEHFRRDYAYVLESRELGGLASIVDFLGRRAGHCTYFAAAAALMLRTQGVPARLATGYLASDWVQPESGPGFFRVTTRNGHAWIEVHFEEEGWVTYDPTPPDRREAAWAAADQDPERGLARWLAELRDHAAFWASSGGHDAYLSALFETLLDGPRALLATLRRQPGWLALVLAALVLLIHRRRARRRRVEGAGPAIPAPFEDELQRLLRALAARGHARAPAQTLTELAAGLARAGEPYTALPAVVASLQRARYGARPLGPEESRRLTAFLAALP